MIDRCCLREQDLLAFPQGEAEHFFSGERGVFFNNSPSSVSAAGTHHREQAIEGSVPPGDRAWTSGLRWNATHSPLIALPEFKRSIVPRNSVHGLVADRIRPLSTRALPALRDATVAVVDSFASIRKVAASLPPRGGTPQGIVLHLHPESKGGLRPLRTI
jgi:hypothetical protein